jgi:hypothetical protein
MKKSIWAAMLIMLCSFPSMAQFTVEGGNYNPCEGSEVTISLDPISVDNYFFFCSDADGYTGTKFYKYSVSYSTGTYVVTNGIPIGSYTSSSTIKIKPTPNNWVSPGNLVLTVKGYRDDGSGTIVECFGTQETFTLNPRKNFPSISGLSEINAPGAATYTLGSSIPGVTLNWSVPAGWAINSGQGTTSISTTPAFQDGNVQVTTSPAVTACGYPALKEVEVTDCFQNGQTDHNFCGSNTWSTAFPTSGYGGQNKWPRMIGDFNGDDKDDVIGFANSNVVVGLSTGSNFNHSNWSSGFVYGNGGATQKDYPRMIGDFTGDGKDDIIVFGYSATQVGVSNGSSFSTSPFSSYSGFTYTQGYTDRNVVQRMIGDFNGDGKDDIVGFGYTAHAVALSSGTSFSTAGWTGGAAFTAQTAGMNDLNKYPKMIGDFNGDGKDDVVGFGHNYVTVGLSTGSSFSTSTWTSGFTYGGSGSEQRKYPRMVGDFNGDGKDDIISFGHDAIAVGISTGSSFSSSNWLSGEAFTKASGWNMDGREIGVVDEADYGDAFPNGADLHEIRIADANGDGMDDIIGFFTDGVYVSYSTGIGFMCPDMYSAYSNNGGFNPPAYIRQVGNFDNTDADIEIIGFGYSNVAVMNCDNCTTSVADAEFIAPDHTFTETGYQGWTVDVSHFCDNSNIKIDVSGTTCEDRYFIEISEFNLGTWTVITTVYPTTWTIENAPDEIDLSALYNFQQNKLYMVTFGVGPDWSTEQLWLRISEMDAEMTLSPHESRNHLTKGGLGVTVNGYCSNTISFSAFAGNSLCYSEYKFELIEVSTTNLTTIGSPILQIPSGGGYTTGSLPASNGISATGMVIGKLYRLQLTIKEGAATEIITKYVERTDCVIGPPDSRRESNYDIVALDGLSPSSVYPNPTTNDFVNLEVAEHGAGAVATIFSTSGEMLREFDVRSNETSKITLDGLARGTYLIRLSSDLRVETIRFVKE